MTIVSGEVRLYKALEMGDDLSDGGGMSGNVVVSGVTNNVFPNISRADRTTGKLHLRKTFMKLDNADLEVYSGAHTAIITPTDDDSVNVLMFDLADGAITSPYTEFWDTNAEVLAYIEDYYQNSAVAAGDAVPIAAIAVGDTSITFELLDAYSEVSIGGTSYTDYSSYADDYNKYMHVQANDCLYLVEGGDNEYISVTRVEKKDGNLVRLYAQQPIIGSAGTAPVIIYTRKSYLTIHLKTGTTNSYTTAVTVNSTTVNSDWKCYGYMKASANFTLGDSLLPVVTTNAAILPTIYTNVYVEDNYVLDPPSFATMSFEPSLKETTATIMSAVQVNTTENVLVGIEGETTLKTYTVNIANDIVAGTLIVQYFSTGKWHSLYDDGAGAFTTDSIGSGTIEYTGSRTVKLTLSLFPAPGTHLIFTYRQTDPYELITSDVVSIERVAIGGTTSVTLTFANTYILPYSIRLQFIGHDNNIYTVRDDGAGLLISDNSFYGSSEVESEWNDGVAPGKSRCLIDGVFYVVQRTLQRVASSPTGATWTTTTSSMANSTGLCCNYKAGAAAILVGCVTPVGKWWYSLTVPPTSGTTVASTTTPSQIQNCAVYNNQNEKFISVGDVGTVYTSTGTNDPDLWTSRTSGTTSNLECVYTDMHSASTLVVIAAGAGGALIRSNDGGINWSIITNVFSGTIHDLWYDTGTSTWFACGTNGEYSLSYDDGVTWIMYDDTHVFSTDTLLTVHSNDEGTFFVGSAQYIASTSTPSVPDSWVQKTYDGSSAMAIDENIVWINYDPDRGIGIALSLVNHKVVVDNPYTEITGTVDVVAGTGAMALTASGDGINSNTTATYLLTKNVATYTFITDGNIPGTGSASSGFSVKGWDIASGTAITIYEDPDDPPGIGVNEVELIGATDVETSYFYRTYGYAIVTFTSDVRPDSLLKSYYFARPLQTAYLPNLDDSRLPANGLVSVVKTNDLCVITDGTQYDMGLVVGYSETSVQLAGALNHNYNSGEILVCTCPYPSDLVADESLHFGDDLFTIWADTQQNGPPDGSYDFTNYPVTLTNLGATTERWYVKMKNVASPPNYLVDVIGENLGTIETNIAVSGELAPINPISGTAYFTMEGAGWDVNWKINEIQRVNTEGAMFPIWLARVTNAQSSDVTDDSVTLEIRGDVGV